MTNDQCFSFHQHFKLILIIFFLSCFFLMADLSSKISFYLIIEIEGARADSFPVVYVHISKVQNLTLWYNPQTYLLILYTNYKVLKIKYSLKISILILISREYSLTLLFLFQVRIIDYYLDFLDYWIKNKNET